MNFIETDIEDLYIVELNKIGDERGFFARAWCEKEFSDKNLTSRMVQANTSYSKDKGTLRGLHYQVSPHQEAKLMRCIKGAIFDVAVDLRPDSKTYKKWFGIELTESNRNMLFIPEGFAHGYLTLVEDTEAFYMSSAFYAPEAERGVRWNDPAIGIEWPITDNLNITDKD
ncbi:MAG: dTDP-4-dehydrorhamnose 3,5-epimerase, partial [Proteobacteria bacterium]|nr:dTDP-4-dehydrorhamnose 3,5-epimerase [Pseudomonadota bacterium]